MTTDRKRQTYGAREAREAQRGYVYAWLRLLFESGMRQQLWKSRAEAARWLTAEGRSAAKINRGAKLIASNEPSRGYSRDLYLKLRQWEIQLGLTYRPAYIAPPYPDPDADFTVFDRPPNISVQS